MELAREGAKPVVRLAKDLGISESWLRNWMAQADADENGSQVNRLTRSQVSLHSSPAQAKGDRRDKEGCKAKGTVGCVV